MSYRKQKTSHSLCTFAIAGKWVITNNQGAKKLSCLNRVIKLLKDVMLPDLFRTVARKSFWYYLTLNMLQPPHFVESVFTTLRAHQVIWLHRNNCVTQAKCTLLLHHFPKAVGRFRSLIGVLIQLLIECSVTEDSFDCWSCKHDAYMTAYKQLVWFIFCSSKWYATACIVP